MIRLPFDCHWGYRSAWRSWFLEVIDVTGMSEPEDVFSGVPWAEGPARGYERSVLSTRVRI
jgi:hypothetical protein